MYRGVEARHRFSRLTHEEVSVRIDLLDGFGERGLDVSTDGGRSWRTLPPRHFPFSPGAVLLQWRWPPSVLRTVTYQRRTMTWSIRFWDDGWDDSLPNRLFGARWVALTRSWISYPTSRRSAGGPLELEVT